MEKKERGEYSLDGETTISNFSVLKSSLSFPKLDIMILFFHSYSKLATMNIPMFDMFIAPSWLLFMVLVFVLSLVDLFSTPLLEVSCTIPFAYFFVMPYYIYFLDKFFCSIAEALSRLDVVIRHPNALHADNIIAYDNVVSALGKICQFHRDSINAAQVVPAWLSCLPIKGDLIEAKVVHDQLCSMVERSDRELIGPNNQYLSKIVAVFAEILCAGNDLATE
ncbi:uncharacterized protein [Glycine max]|uniref:uncharacterized protein n=1 Tax=Glycine max TaxID=3847 RepID=UPI001B357CF8|nr:uncharacterized protein LOC102665984 [Glycine max]